MAIQTTQGITALKQLPAESSSNVRAIGEAVQSLYDVAKGHYGKIDMVADMRIYVSASAVSECWDHLAVIRQIESALTELAGHFAETVAGSSIDVPHHRTKDILRKAEERLQHLSRLVER